MLIDIAFTTTINEVLKEKFKIQAQISKARYFRQFVLIVVAGYGNSRAGDLNI